MPIYTTDERSLRVRGHGCWLGLRTAGELSQWCGRSVERWLRFAITPDIGPAVEIGPARLLRRPERPHSPQWRRVVVALTGPPLTNWLAPSAHRGASGRLVLMARPCVHMITLNKINAPCLDKHAYSFNGNHGIQATLADCADAADERTRRHLKAVFRFRGRRTGG